MKEKERERETIIPEEDFREAIAACCEDPLLQRYFQLAPTGAKLFIGLGFYSTHFGDKVDPRQYAECQAEIEPALTIVDLKYLIRFEEDRNTKRYLKGLLGKRFSEGVDGNAARRNFREQKFVAALLCNLIQYFAGTSRHFRSDPVAGDDRDLKHCHIFHLTY